jgi:hypothetical protein
MDDYIEDLAQELVEALAKQGNDDLASSLMVLLGDFGIYTALPEGDPNETSPTH